MKKYAIYTPVALAFLVVCFIASMAFADDTLTAKANAVYGPDGMVEVTNTIEYTGDISAIAIKVDLPHGVELQSATGDVPPAISARKGDTGLLEFAWVTPPASPFTFKYSALVYDKNAEGNIYASVTYRRTGAPLYADMDPVNIK